MLIAGGMMWALPVDARESVIMKDPTMEKWTWVVSLDEMGLMKGCSLYSRPFEMKTTLYKVQVWLWKILMSKKLNEEDLSTKLGLPREW